MESMRNVEADAEEVTSFLRNCPVYVACDPFNFAGNGASIGNRIEEKLRE